MSEKLSHKELDRIFALSLDLICIADINTATFRKINPAFTELLGYSEKELVSKPFYEFIHPDDIESTRDVVEQKLKAGAGVINFENRYRCKDESYRWLSWTSHPDPEKGLTYAVARDISEKKQYEKAAAESRMLLEATSRMAKIGGWELDLKTRKVLWTQMTGKIHGVPDGFYPPLEKAIAYYHPDDRKMVEDYVNQAIEQGTPYEFEARLVTPQGQQRWVRAIGEPTTEEGKCIRLNGTIQDITERKQADEALSESEAFLKNLLDAIPNPVFFKDSKGCYLGFNEAFEKHSGRKRDALIGKTVIEVLPPDQAEVHAAKDRELFRMGGRQEYESRVPYYSGESRDVIFSKAVFRNPDGSVGGLIGTIQDISKLKKTETRLLEASDKLCFLVDSLIDSLIITNRDGTVRFVNNAACELFARKKEDFIGTAFGFPITLDKIFEITTISPDGISRYAEAKSNTIEWDGEEGYLLSLRDITERKKAQEEREKLDQHVRQVDKIESIGNLAGGIAHDFNNMLSVIMGYTQMAKEVMDPDSDLSKDFDEILSAANRAADITRQLLAFARQQAIAPKVIDLNQAIEGLLKMLRRLIGENITLSWQPGANLWPISIDPTQVDQIVANICINARDAIDGNGKIVIETKNISLDETYKVDHGFSPGDYVFLSISDDGSGMSTEVQKKIFEPFFSTKEIGKGTGLGLATVYGIVKQNKGFIYVYSELEVGTIFNIYLPKYTDADTREDENEDRAEIPRGKGEVIMIVEDEGSILKLSIRTLQQLGYSVLGADCPSMALRLAEKHEPHIDLLLTDVIMPEMSGRKLAERLMGAHPNLKVLFMSGYTADVIAHRGVLDQGIHFLQKPFSKIELATKVRQVLHDRREDEKGENEVPRSLEKTLRKDSGFTKL